MERSAIGYCGLSAEAFNAMTPMEFQWRLQADVERENRELERIAQLACWLINPHLKRGQQLTVNKLIKRRKPTE
jgi:hypothetical protein